MIRRKPTSAAYIPWTLTVLWLVFHFLFVWVNQHGDGYYYLAFGRYLLSGEYPFMWPYMYARPTTIAAPLLSMVWRLFLPFAHAERLLHAYQLVLLGGTAYLLYRLMRRWTGAARAAAVAFAFTVLPTSIIYASYNMTEMTAQFLFMAWITAAVSYLDRKTPVLRAVLIAVAAVATLARYQYAVLFILSVAWWLMTAVPMASRVRGLSPFVRVPRMLECTAAFLGIAVIGVWIWFNYTITGVVGLSDTNRLRFQATLVYDGKYVPPESDPAAVELRRYIPAWMPLHYAWWDYQNYILPKTGQDWREVDRIVGNVGIAVLKRQPWVYPVNTLRIFWRLHTDRTQPWWDNISTAGLPPTPPLALYCNDFFTVRFCEPIIMTRWSYPVWNTATRLMQRVYAGTAPYVFVGILFPSILVCLVWGDASRRLYAGVYLVLLIAIASSVFVDTRYLVVFYPLMILIVTGAATRLGALVSAALRRARRT